MFAGTGSGTWDNGQEHQFGALTDILSLRDGDNIIFYVERHGFYGVFKVKKFDDKNCVFYESLDNHKYIDELNQKILTYRVLIKPNHEIGVFKNGVSEWNMIENPEYIKDFSVLNMQWSWIFKKLKGKRGCLSIPNDEFENILQILSKNNTTVPHSINYDFSEGKIVSLNDGSINYGDIPIESTYEKIYSPITTINEEIDLRKFFARNIGNTENDIFDDIVSGEVVSILNEIKCSFGDKSIDLLIGMRNNECYLIELKNNFEYNEAIYSQLYLYSRWLSSYKNYDKIFPILILREPRGVASRKGSFYFKYLSEEDRMNHITSEWFNKIIEDINSGKERLAREGIRNLQELRVFIFKTDENNKLVNFIQLV